MYTVVLMAALATGPAATGQNWTRGSAATTCTCRSCFGCFGGYSNSGYNYMAAHGFQSSFSVYAPVSNASIYAPVSNANVFGCRGCYGCYGGWSCYGVPLANHGTWNEGVPQDVVPEKNKQPIEETPAPKEKLPAPNKLSKPDDQVRARLTIDAPADAKVFVDGELLKSSITNRVFQTPALIPGHTYYYDIRAEIARDGRTLTSTKRILLLPGQSATAVFPDLNPRPTSTAQTER